MLPLKLYILVPVLGSKVIPGLQELVKTSSHGELIPCLSQSLYSEACLDWDKYLGVSRHANHSFAKSFTQFSSSHLNNLLQH